MNSLSIEHFLIHELDFSLSKRQKAIDWVLEKQISSEKIIQWLDQTSGKSKVHLLCFCETLAKQEPFFFENHLDYFLKIASEETHESNKRSLTNLYIIFLKKTYKTITDSQKEKLVERCFSWLLDESLIATQCNCLTCLEYLSQDQQWIREELLQIIDKDFTSKPPSYQSRARKILKKLGRN